MKKSIITLFVFMLMCTCILQCSASAKERKFKKQDISYHKTDNQASKLHVTGAGKVKYIRHNYVEKYNTKRLYWNSIG